MISDSYKKLFLLIFVLYEINNDIDEQAMDVKKAQEFTNKKEIMENILNISQKQAEALGVSRSRLHGIKDRIRNDGDLNLDTPAVRRLITNGLK